MAVNSAPGKDSEVYLKPVSFYPDPFRLGDNVLVLCETCLPDGKLTPIPTNTRSAAAQVMMKASNHRPMFGIEQEYTLYHADGHTILGWPRQGFPRPQVKMREFEQVLASMHEIHDAFSKLITPVVI